MTRCEKLQALLEEAMVDGDGALIEALEAALAAAGCTNGEATAQGGGTGNGPPRQ